MGSRLLGDLNDYIQPSVACIKPENTLPKKDDPERGRTVQINLNDCLACSGCITSAETILVTEQTHHQIYSVVEENKALPTEKRRHIVVSICPSTRTALAHRFRLTPVQTFKMLRRFFINTLGVTMVFDTSFASYFALKAASDEFIKAFTSSENMPMLSSECPGWICYAEKKQPKLLPQICTVKSLQQICGALTKSYLLDRLDSRRQRKDIYHVAVMSCYDKKLEASRSDFSDEDGVRDVDCVITTTELVSMMEECGSDSRDGDNDDDSVRLDEGECFESRFKSWGMNKDKVIQMIGATGTSAGGYLFWIMKSAALELFGIELSIDITLDPRVRVQQHRSEDYTEYTLIRDGVDLLRFAAVYGFRNIQTFIQKSKIKKVDYHYVEVMACPGACLFGGGQSSAAATATESKEALRSEMEQIYSDRLVISPESAGEISEVDEIYRWISADPSRQSIFHTSYHSLEETTKKRPLINVQW